MAEAGAVRHAVSAAVTTAADATDVAAATDEGMAQAVVLETLARATEAIAPSSANERGRPAADEHAPRHAAKLRT